MLSIIIPVYNEEKILERTILNLTAIPGCDEIIIVDGGSTDGTLDICSRHPDIKLLQSPKGRAVQMNRGAQHASGEILLFLHADTELPDNALTSIRAKLFEENYDAGGFSHSFGDRDWRLRMISYLDNRRCEQTGIIYGDQAMFVKRTVFEELGGFPEVAVMEDIYFCERLIEHCKPVIIQDHVITDPRKFIKMGIWRSLFRVIIIQVRNELNMPVAKDYPFFADIR